MSKKEFDLRNPLKSLIDALDELPTFRETEVEERIIVAYQNLTEAQEFLKRQAIIDSLKDIIENDRHIALGYRQPLHRGDGDQRGTLQGLPEGD